MRSKDWYHGAIGAKDAESRLKLDGRPGIYLVRRTPFNDFIVLSFIDETHCFKMKIFTLSRHPLAITPL